MINLIKKRQLIARILIALVLFVPLTSTASVMAVSDQHAGHCLGQLEQVDTQNISPLVQQLCTMDECIESCETLLHCSSHNISITSAEIGFAPVKPESPAYRPISSPYPGDIQYNLFRPPRS